MRRSLGPDDDHLAIDGATVQWVGLVPCGDDPRPAVATMPAAGIQAIVVGESAGMPAGLAFGPPADLGLLIMPSSPDHDGTLPTAALTWVEQGGPTQVIALHGTVVAWAPERAAILVAPERLAAVRTTVVEFWFHERELRAIEADVSSGWPEVQAHAPLAFEFRDRDAGHRHALAQRFRLTVALRARHARLGPHLERPPLYPPTLASQVAERLRERSRMVDRAAYLDPQIAVQERVYDLCGERASEWALARRSRSLEWAIVVLLVLQTAMLVVEMLSNSGA